MSLRSEIRIPFFLIGRTLRSGNKWTLVLIVFLMAIAFINLLFIASLFNGIVKSANNQIIDTFTGHILVTPLEGQDYIEGVGEVLATVRGTAGIKSTAPHVVVPATLKYQAIKLNTPIVAIDPEAEPSVTIVADHMVSGEYLVAGDTDQIIIGQQTAGGEKSEMKAFSLKDAQVGDRVTLALGSVTKEFTIKGIFDTKFMDNDKQSFITTAAYAAMNPAVNDRATSILIRVKDDAGIDGVLSSLRQDNIQATLYRWDEASGLMKSVAGSFLSIDVLLSSVGILIAAVTIFIVIYIDISNKRQQIGILRAIGIKPYLIRATYVLLALLYSICGVGLGTGLFFAGLVPYFIAHPFTLPIGDATLLVDWADYTYRVQSILLVTIISALIPAILITRIKILDAISGK